MSTAVTRPVAHGSPTGGEGVSLRAKSLAWRRKEVWPAFVVSVVAHLSLIIVAALVVVGRAAGDGHGAGLSAPVEMAVITEAELDQLQAPSLGSALPAVPDSPLREDELLVPGDSAPGNEMASDAGVLTDVGPLAGGGELTSGGGMGLGGAGGGGTSFFGVEASGNRIAFLVDVSSSMADGDRIGGLKSELTKSVQRMDNGTEFIIIAFSSGKQVLGERVEWRETSDSGKRWANAQISLLGPSGGTEPLPGFQVLFTMRPRPDAIYFMTDGEFDANVTALVAELNVKLRIPIHCICFGANHGEEEMKKIAAQSRGTYRFVPQK